MSCVRVAVSSLVIVLSALATASAQPRARGGAQLLSEPMLNRYGLTKSWWSHGTINSQRDKLRYMVVDETHLFLQSSSGIITAFDADSGRHLWTKQIGASDRSIYPASSNDELLFVVNGTRLFAIRKSTGDTLWQLGMPGMPASSPAADKYRVYVGFVDGSLYAFDLKETQSLYTAGKLPQYSESAVLWRYRTSKSITAPAIPAEGVVAFASRNGSLYSVTTDDRKLVFQFETDAALTAPIVRYRDKLLLASEDFNFYSLDIRNGSLGWQFTAGVVIKKAPVLIDDEVYLFPNHGSMYKLSAETGKVYWSVPRMTDFLAASTNRVYVTDRANNLTILTRDHGEPLGMFPLDQYQVHLANDRSDRIYVATEGGLVMCLREQRREFARFHMHPDRQPILPDFAPEGAADDSPDESADESADGEPAEMEPADDEGKKADADEPGEEMPADEKPGDDDADADKPADEAADDAPTEEAAEDDATPGE